MDRTGTLARRPTRLTTAIGRLLALLLLGAGVCLIAPGVHAQPEQGTLTVAIKALEPFVMKEGDNYAGFSIDLWREIALRNGWRYEFLWVETVGEQLDAVEQGRADVAIAGISMTPEREERVDFSFPMFNAGLQVMTGEDGSSVWRDVVGTFISPALLRVLAFILLIVIAAGHVIWLVQRARNEQWPKGYLGGVWEGIWVAGTTLVTSDVGDHAPRRVAARVVALLWMFFAVILIAYFTAVATSNLTVKQIEGTLRGPNDLPGKRVVTVQGSTADDWLRQSGIAHDTVPAIDEAYEQLERNEADAVVYDAPVLQYYALHEGKGELSVVGPIFQREDYGIALPRGSPLRKPINLALLEIRADGTYQRLYTRWFGAQESQR